VRSEIGGLNIDLTMKALEIKNKNQKKKIIKSSRKVTKIRERRES